jgi:uncharacterized coiled-coil protein SlyX
MEMKSINRIAPAKISMIIVLLLSGSILGGTDNFAWGQPSSPSVEASSPVSPAPASPNLSSPTSKPSFPSGDTNPQLFLWLAIGGLGIWSLLLSFLTFRTIKWCDEKISKVDRRIRELETKDAALDQRINRRSTSINELKHDLSLYKKTLDTLQLQAQQKSIGADRSDFHEKVTPYDYSQRQPATQDNYIRQGLYSQPLPKISEPWDIIAQNYNNNPATISLSAQGVSETEDSIYRRRRDSSIKQVTLQTISNYSYWIISDAEGGYWLTPIPELKLNPMNFDTFQALFQFNGEPLSGKLQLTKPARVNQASTDQWELIDRGEVQFL